METNKQIANIPFNKKYIKLINLYINRLESRCEFYIACNTHETFWESIKYIFRESPSQKRLTESYKKVTEANKAFLKECDFLVLEDK